MANQDGTTAAGPFPGADTGRLLGEEATHRRRTNPGGQGPQTGRQSDADGSSGSGSSGGNRDVIEALLLAATRAQFGRGLTNRGFLAMGALHFHLRRRRRATNGAVLPFEHLERTEPITQAAMYLARQADPRAAASYLPGVDAQQVREAQRTLRHEDMAAVLGNEPRATRLEDATRDGVQARGADPTTPPEELWKRFRGDDLDPTRMQPRDLAMHWLSATASTEPGALEVKAKLTAALATHHPQLAEALEHRLAQDPNLRDDPYATRVNQVSALADGSVQANARPEQDTEQYWTRLVARFTDRRLDLDTHRSNAQLLAGAVRDGTVHPAHLHTAAENAKQNIPGFREIHDRRLNNHREKANEETRVAGGTDRFPHGDAMLDAFDRLRDLPSTRTPNRAATVHTVSDHRGEVLSRHAEGMAADPRSMRDMARRPVDQGQHRRGAELAGTAVARPNQQRLNREQRRTEIADGRQRAVTQRDAYRRGQNTARSVGRDSARLRSLKARNHLQARRRLTAQYQQTRRVNAARAQQTQQIRQNRRAAAR